jgi:hypothetical protein
MPPGPHDRATIFYRKHFNVGILASCAAFLLCPIMMTSQGCGCHYLLSQAKLTFCLHDTTLHVAVSGIMTNSVLAQHLIFHTFLTSVLIPLGLEGFRWVAAYIALFWWTSTSLKQLLAL